MTDEEILKGLYDFTILGKAPNVKDLTQAGLDQKMDPVAMLYQALLPALQEVGRRFEIGDFFVPEMLMSARAMQAALNLLRPLLAAAGEIKAEDLKRIGRREVHTVHDSAGQGLAVGKHVERHDRIVVRRVVIDQQLPIGAMRPRGNGINIGTVNHEVRRIQRRAG